jgi:TolA-binding protein
MAELNPILDDTPDDVEIRLEDLEGALMEGAEGDGRLASGTVGESVNADLDFIQMTGLTRPAPESDVVDSPAISPAQPASPALLPPDMDPDAPLSFYEEGVDDVDTALAPETFEPGGTAEEDVIVGPPVTDSGAANSLRDIISDLTGDSTEEAKEEENDVEAASIYALPTPLEDAVEESLFVERAAPVDTDVALDEENVSLEESTEAASESPPPEDRPEHQAETPLETFVLEEAAAVPGGSATVDEPPALPPQTAIPDLEEAKDLLQALDAQKRDIAEFDPTDYSDAKAQDLVESVDATGSACEGPLDGRRKKSLPRAVWTWPVRGAVVSLVIAGAFVGYREFALRTETPEEGYGRAISLMAEERYEEASAEFLRFIENSPGSSLRPEAQFRAAFALSLVPEFPAAAASASYARGAELFVEFIENNPSHAKRARAETLLGALHYRSGDYGRAISLLEDRRRLLSDPDAYLLSLRFLGRAHARLGQVEEARAAFLRAADLEGNYSPNSDYLELASIYRNLALESQSFERQREYLAQAVEMWESALKTPGLTESQKRPIRWLIAVETEEEQQEAEQPVTVDESSWESSNPPPAKTNSKPRKIVELQPLEPEDESNPGE